jgi:GT2 family glycosyltransferase
VHQEFKLSIITINYNGLEDTCALIDSIPFDDMPSLEVIVVDNASKADEATIIEQRYPQVKVIRSNENLGFAGGNNLGIRAAHGRYLFFINNDTLLRCGEREAECEERAMSLKDFFRPLIQRLERSPKVGAISPKIRFAWKEEPIQFAGYTPLSTITLRNKAIGCGEKDTGQYDKPHPTPYLHGAAMMVRRDAIEKVGLMPECYFLYYEELDWSMMFRRAGYELWYDSSATVYHKESQSTGQNSPLKTYYLTRNRLLFARRNISRPMRWLNYLYLLGPVLLRDTTDYLLRMKMTHLKYTWAGCLDFLTGKYGKRTFHSKQYISQS